MNSQYLILTNVYKNYEEPYTEVLKGIDLNLSLGESIAIVGVSGTGKSTLLNLIAGLDRPTQGSIQVNSRDLATLEAPDLCQLRNQEIGFIFQLHHLFPQCTVLENVLIPSLAWPRKSPKQYLDRARLLLKRVGLQDRMNHYPFQLSGGERQRVAVARSLIQEPKLILADEPTGALDQSTAHQLIQLLLEFHQEQGNTLIVVTHDWEIAAQMKQCQQLQHGKLAPWVRL